MAEPSVELTLQDVQWQHIQRVLAHERGSVSKAAKRLGVPRSSLYEMLRRGEGPKRREHKGETADVSH